MRGADGVKIAVLRKGHASLVFIWAAAHRRRSVSKKNRNLHWASIGCIIETRLEVQL
jgi:hypothetical protein